MRRNDQQAEDEAIKARERASRSTTTRVPNLASLVQDEVVRSPSGRMVQSKPSPSIVAAVAPPPMGSSVSREEEDRLIKERERASRSAVVPNLASIIQGDSSTSVTSPSGDVFSTVNTNTMATAAAMPPSFAPAQSTSSMQSTMSQQEQDEIAKQRERNARAASVVPNLASRVGQLPETQVASIEPPVMVGAISVSGSNAPVMRVPSLSRSQQDQALKDREKQIRASNTSATIVEHTVLQQERDLWQKERERQARNYQTTNPVVEEAQIARYNVVNDLLGDDATDMAVDQMSYAPTVSEGSADRSNSGVSEDLVRARYQAATMAMNGHLTQEDEDFLMKERERQASSQQQSSFVTPSGAQERSSGINAGASTNAGDNDVGENRHILAPGAVAVSNGRAEQLEKITLISPEPSRAPDGIDDAHGNTHDDNDTLCAIDSRNPHDDMDDHEKGYGGQSYGYTSTALDKQLETRNESHNLLPVDAVPVKDVESKSTSRRKWYLLGAVTLVVIIAVAVGVAVAAGDGGDQPSTVVGNSPGETSTPNAEPIVESDRLIALREFMITEGLSSSDQLTDPSSPQYKALTWIADVDLSTDINDATIVTPRYALAVFYYSMDGANWIDESEWLDPNMNVCDWERITCTGGDVATIKEENAVNMVGVIPTELNALPYLTSLTLNNNKVLGLMGPIQSLIELSLQNANLGERGRGIPSHIVEMTNLQKLYLTNNAISGTISTDIAKLTSLIVLDLSTNNFSGTLSSHIHTLMNLVDISIANNKLGGDFMEIFRGMPSVEGIRCGGNKFTGSIGPEITEFSKLGRLELGSNSITGTFPNSLLSLTTLGFVDFSFNSLTGTLSTEIVGSVKLGSLLLDGNQLSGSIPSELARFSRLRQIKLKGCGLTGIIPTEIGVLSALENLHLDTNQLTGPIPSELGNLSSLQTMYLDSNFLAGPVPSELGQLSSLMELRLNGNALSGDLPSEICAIDSLSTVQLIAGFNSDGLSCGDCAKCF